MNDYIEKPQSKLNLVHYTAFAGILITLLISALFVGYGASLFSKDKAPALTQEQTRELDQALNSLYPERTALVSNLPYNTKPADVFINAESAILIDYNTGSILYEKNADEKIPPASMTKLVEMHVVLNAIKQGKISLEDVVPLPPQSWSVNLPSDASRMGLAEGDIVTLRELLLGLAICSGNDASIAVANYVAGSMDAFVDRMNEEIEKLGLKQTHFVESSGYSEQNITTPREFIQFCRFYVNEHPEALRLFHSQKEITYPNPQNIPPEKRNEERYSYTQPNTNKALDHFNGCDGLKTGYIDESGFNLALTAQQGTRRFISVTMKGPGETTIEGSRLRAIDGIALMKFAFDSFADYVPPEKESHCYTAGVAGGREKKVTLIPAVDEKFTVPFIGGSSPEDCAENVNVKADFPAVIYGSTKAGTQYGTLTYSVDGTVLRKIPLVADRDVEKGGPLKRLAGRIISCMTSPF